MTTKHRALKAGTLRPGQRVLPKTVPPRPDDFPIVGLGASAGGLEVFQKLFTALPADSGMAFILIQHLDPTHESMMAALLSSNTDMKVLQATDGMTVERDHVYLIPPRVYLSIRSGLLHLSPPLEKHGARMPFDFFLRSLAEDCGERAICVVLSGTGADGSVGLKYVRERGGLVIVQDPAQAAYDGMPRSAVLTGDADLILPMEKIPEALKKYVRRAPFIGAGNDPTTLDSPSVGLTRILDLLRTKTSHNFAFYKTGTLLRRTERRMAIVGITDSERYLEILRGDTKEFEFLAKDLLIHVTGFFRDADAFKTLAETIIPELVRQRTTDQPLRIWIPACSTGEETYSIAMLFLEEIAAAKRNIKLQVFASDVENNSIAVARNGLYPDTIRADVSQARLDRFFVKEENGYRVISELREAVIFTVQDILADAPFSRLDLVSCRNLLIYLRPEVQEKVLLLFHFALREGGILFLGTSEKVGNAAIHFEAIAGNQPIFRHNGRSRPGEVDFPISAGDGVRTLAFRAERQAAAQGAGLGDVSRKLLLEAYAPPSVLINRKCEGLYYFGATDRYLQIPAGDTSQDIFAMAREGLRTRLRAAIQQATRENGHVLLTGARVSREGHTTTVSIDVRPVQNGGGEMQLVSFIDEPERAISATGTVEPEADVSRIAQLQQELDATREDLQSAIRDLEISGDEQKAINEEAMSVNEEFQSTNEELETSKEELQSLNEELTALNSQLHETVEQQRRAANDLQNILNSANVATIFLDGKMNIRLFTAATKSHFNIIATDIGRPLADLARRSNDRELLIDAGTVLASLVPISREIEGDKDVWYVRRILPYRKEDDRVEGVVITFTDISEMKVAEREIEAARTYSNSIVETIRQPLIVLDDELRIISASRAFYRTFNVTPEEAVGRIIGTLRVSYFKHAGLRSFLEKIQNGGADIKDYEIEFDMPLLGRRSLLITARLIQGPAMRRKILMTIDDVTDRKRISNVLETAKLQAERANLAKSRFLAAASHDLRQPLQTLSLLRGILTKTVKDESALTLLAKFDQTLDVMSGMLNTLLDINQLEAGIVKPDIAVFPIETILEHLKSEFSYHAAVKGLACHVVASSLYVQSDPHLLEQMIRNLLSNAVKYTVTGKILLGCRRKHDMLSIEVWDTGIGIAERHLEEIFEEFNQIDNPARDRDLGLGLGLAIVQRMGHLLGHSISVRSHLGKGSVFVVDVPLAQGKPKIPVERDRYDAEKPAQRPNTVLIVEDDPVMREMLEFLFKADGHRTAVTAAGKGALDLVAAGALRPDIVIADYNLPGGMTGVQTIAGLRECMQQEIPAIVLTGDISTDTLREIVQQNCVHLHKPAKAEDLTHIVKTLLAGRPSPSANSHAPTKAELIKASRVESRGTPSQQTIFVIDDNAAVRENMLELLALDGRTVEVYSSCEAFLGKYRPERKGCLLVDARMPGMNGIELLEQLKAGGNGLPSIMMTGYGDVPMAVRAMKAGAVDFIEKPINTDELLVSIATVLERTYDIAKNAVWRDEAIKSIATLTAREHDVMDMVLAGHPSKNIAADLGISQRTVENHRASVMKKTGSKSIPALIRTALAAA